MQDITTSLDTLEESLNETKEVLAQKGVQRDTLQAIDVASAIDEIVSGNDTFSVFTSSEVREALEEGYNGAAQNS